MAQTGIMTRNLFGSQLWRLGSPRLRGFLSEESFLGRKVERQKERNRRGQIHRLYILVHGQVNDISLFMVK